MKKRKSNRGGAVVVEAALMLPFLMIVTFGAIDLAQYINAGQLVTNTSREVARTASRNKTQSVTEVQATALSYLQESIPNFPDNGVTVTVEQVSFSQNGGTQTSPINDEELGDVESGDAISVTVNVDFSLIRWLPGFDYGPLQTTTVCRRD